MKKTNKFDSIGKWFMSRPESSIVLALILYVTIVTIVNPVFLSGNNVVNVLRSTGFYMIVVVGMTYVLITAGLDLSVGSVFALGAIICGLCTKAGLPVIISILLGLLVGLAIGLFNGIMIVKTGIPPLIVTLGMQYVARGLVQVLTKGVPVYPLPKSFVAIEHFRLFGAIPVVVIISIIVALIGHFILTQTVFGRSIFAIGGNEEAAKISGINIRQTKVIVYALVAVLAAFSGILMSSRLGSAEPSTGSGFEMKVICGAIIGGTSTFGGMGTILGAALGSLFMEIVTNSLTLMRISVYWQNLVFGVILMGSVLLDQYRRSMILRQSIKAKDKEDA